MAKAAKPLFICLDNGTCVGSNPTLRNNETGLF
jgi:hypothetical protein